MDPLDTSKLAPLQDTARAAGDQACPNFSHPARAPLHLASSTSISLARPCFLVARPPDSANVIESTFFLCPSILSYRHCAPFLTQLTPSSWLESLQTWTSCAWNWPAMPSPARADAVLLLALLMHHLNQRHLRLPSDVSGKPSSTTPPGRAPMH